MRKEDERREVHILSQPRGGALADVLVHRVEAVSYKQKNRIGGQLVGDHQFKTGLGKVNWFFVGARWKSGPVNRDTRPVIGRVWPTGRLIRNNLQRFLLRVVRRYAVDPVDGGMFGDQRIRTAVRGSGRHRPSRSTELPGSEEKQTEEVIDRG